MKTVGHRALVRTLQALALAATLGIVACQRATEPGTSAEDAETPTGPAWFADMTDAVGLDFVHDAGPTGNYFMPQSMGSGCAFLDVDGDGLLDIYLLHHGGPGGKKNQLFRQTPNRTFEDISRGSGLDIAGYSTGVAVGDVNNDGMPDVVVAQYGGLRLFLNIGSGHFRDATDEAALVNPLWATSAAFLDFDRDGLLDLVVVNYLDYDRTRDCLSPQGVHDYCSPNSFPGRVSKLYRNRGPAPDGSAAVRFEDVSFASGIGKLAGPGLGVVCADFDGDGWPDIFVANDGQPNRLWINQTNRTFRDEAASRGVAYTTMGKAYAGMGIAVGDTTGSGLFDLFVTHLGSETHTLWRQGPRGEFRDLSPGCGLNAGGRHGTGWGTVLADFDHDGALDVAIANGRAFRGGKATSASLGFWETYAERNQLFANDGTGKFRELSVDNPDLCGHWNVARGLACADYDNDGAPDLLITTVGGRARLFRNVVPARGHWLHVRAIDPALKRDAYGAEVRVRAGQRQLRLINPAQSYLSSGSALAMFGLGLADRYDAIEVTWPGGTRERFVAGLADRVVVVRKGEGRAP